MNSSFVVKTSIETEHESRLVAAKNVLADVYATDQVLHIAGLCNGDLGTRSSVQNTPQNNKNVRLFGVRAPIFIIILIGVRSVMGSGKYFTDVRSKKMVPRSWDFFGSPERLTTLPQALFFFSEKWPPIFWKPWMSPYVAAGAFFFSEKWPPYFWKPALEDFLLFH